MAMRSLLLGGLASLMLAGGASAADFYSASAPANDIYSSPLFDFEGLYAGGSLGGRFGDDGALSAGVVVGINYAVADIIYAGLEFQADGIFRQEGWTYDAYALLHLGGLVTDGLMVYAAAGIGTTGGDNGYALGGGAEYALMEPLTVRGEILATGDWGGGFDGGKATASLIWHFD